MRSPESTPQSDALADAPADALVRRAMAGEREAFGALYERHVDAVFRYIRFRVSDVALASDLTQDVFISAFRGIARLQHPERFGAWLIQIAHNRVLNDRRARSRQAGHIEWQADGDALAAELPSPAPDPARQVELRLAGERVAAATESLTEIQQQVLALRFVAGLSLTETAELLGRTEDAVKKLQRRALATLRGRLIDGELTEGERVS
jgi:RNA polymerase sigma-70 factor (ECF subfamily)